MVMALWPCEDDELCPRRNEKYDVSSISLLRGIFFTTLSMLYCWQRGKNSIVCPRTQKPRDNHYSNYYCIFYMIGNFDGSFSRIEAIVYRIIRLMKTIDADIQRRSIVSQSKYFPNRALLRHLATSSRMFVTFHNTPRIIFTYKN